MLYCATTHEQGSGDEDAQNCALPKHTGDLHGLAQQAHLGLIGIRGLPPCAEPLLIPIGYSVSDDESGFSQIADYAGEPRPGKTQTRSADDTWTYGIGPGCNPPK